MESLVKVDDTRINLNRYKYSYRSLAMAPESLLVVLSLTDKSASVLIPM